MALSLDGLRAGERVAILEPNSTEFLESYFAAAALGAILVPLNTRLAAAELAQILAHSGARVLSAHGSFAALVEAVLARGASIDQVVWAGAGERPANVPSRRYDDLAGADAGGFQARAVGPEHVAQIYYTSGTTGAPKGVMLTHA